LVLKARGKHTSTPAGSKQQAASSRQQAASSKQQAAGSRQQAAYKRSQTPAQGGVRTESENTRTNKRFGHEFS
jgi:hypothetical protein